MTTVDYDKNSADFEIEEAVLSFLGRHPQAADTLEGIAEWWLPQQRYVTAKARIDSASFKSPLAVTCMSSAFTVLFAKKALAISTI